MSDRSFNIKITTSADTSGATAQAAALKNLTQQTADAASATRDKLNPAGAEWSKTATDAAGSTAQSTVATKDLKAAISGLSLEFPILGRVTRMFLNPLSFAVAGITGAFTIWNARLRDATNLLAGVELPDITDPAIGRITAAVEAWETYAKAVNAVKTAYSNINSETDRRIDKINEELGLNKQLLGAMREAELGKLEAQRESMSPEDYQSRRKAIESSYSSVEIGLTAGAKQSIIEERVRQRDKLRADAQAKLGEAGGIRVATAEADQQSEADLKAAAEAAKVDVKAREKRIAELLSYIGGEAGFTESIRVKGRQTWYNMTPQELLDMERQGMDTDQTPIDRYNAFLRRKNPRAEQRERRSTLLSEAGKESAEADVLDLKLPAEQASRNLSMAVDAMSASLKTGNQVSYAFVKFAAEQGGINRDIIQRMLQIEAQNKARP